MFILGELLVLIYTTMFLSTKLPKFMRNSPPLYAKSLVPKLWLLEPTYLSLILNERKNINRSVVLLI